MEDNYLEALKGKIEESQYQKLLDLEMPFINQFVLEAYELCKPDSVFVATDDETDIHYVRRQAIERKEESELATPGHTVHYDGFFDQARDKANTKYLLPPDVHLGEHINFTQRDAGLDEVRGFLGGAMGGCLPSLSNKAVR